MTWGDAIRVLERDRRADGRTGRGRRRSTAMTTPQESSAGVYRSQPMLAPTVASTLALITVNVAIAGAIFLVGAALLR